MRRTSQYSNTQKGQLRRGQPPLKKVSWLGNYMRCAHSALSQNASGPAAVGEVFEYLRLCALTLLPQHAESVNGLPGVAI